MEHSGFLEFTKKKEPTRGHPSCGCLGESEDNCWSLLWEAELTLTTPPAVHPSASSSLRDKAKINGSHIQV
jgi:hypothetical protein